MACTIILHTDNIGCVHPPVGGRGNKGEWWSGEGDMRGGEVCTLRKGEKGNCVGGANMCWHIGGMALKIRWDVRGENFYLQQIPDRWKRGGRKFQRALLRRERYPSTKPDIVKAKSTSHTETSKTDRSRVCVRVGSGFNTCMFVLTGGRDRSWESARERERAKRYRDIVQADWLVWKWEGAKLSNSVTDEQSEEEMATKTDFFPLHFLLSVSLNSSASLFDCVCKDNEKYPTSQTVRQSLIDMRRGSLFA